MPTSIKILSLDGGGSWAMLQAMALGKTYGDDATGHEILGHFDLAVANSGGSLVLAALLLNWKPNEIVAFFMSKEERSKIFVKTSLLNPGNWMPGNRYDTEAKLRGLQEVLVGKNEFGATGKGSLVEVVKRMHDQQPDGRRHTEIVIAGFDYDQERAVFFKSCDGQSSSGTGQMARRKNPIERPDITLAEACHVSSNAPVLYFDDPAVVSFGNDPKFRGWDGAVGGYNNPILAGITEALCIYDCQPQDIQCLSLGSANTHIPIKGRDPGVDKDELFEEESGTTEYREAKKMASSVLDEPPKSATYVALFLMGYSPPIASIQMEGLRLVRMNPMIQPKKTSDTPLTYGLPDWADDAEYFEKMTDIDMDAMKDDQVPMIHDFGVKWLAGQADNQLISEGQSCGHPFFLKAKDCWLALP